jgi:hypothetical protein
MRARTLTALVAVAAIAGPASFALGEEVVVSGTIRPGVLSIGKVPKRIAISKLVADGQGFRRAVVRLPIAVTDARGTGAGWALSVAARLRTAKGRQVHGGLATLWSMSSRCTSCSQVHSRVVMPLRLQEGRAIRAFVATRRHGMGRIILSATIRVAVPTRAPAGGYVLYPSVTRISGP